MKFSRHEQNNPNRNEDPPLTSSVPYRAQPPAWHPLPIEMYLQLLKWSRQTEELVYPGSITVSEPAEKHLLSVRLRFCVLIDAGGEGTEIIGRSSEFASTYSPMLATMASKALFIGGRSDGN